MSETPEHVATDPEPSHIEPSQQADRKKHRKGKVLLLVLFLILCVGAIAFTIFFHVKKNRVALACADLAQELGNRSDPVQEEVGWHEILSQILSGNEELQYHINISRIALQGILDQEMADKVSGITLGLDGSLQRDVENRKLSADVTTSLANQKLFQTQIYAKDTTVFAQIPLFMDRPISFQTRNMQQEINASPFAGMLHLHLDQDVNVDPFQKIKWNRIDHRKFALEHAEDIKACYDQAQISEKTSQEMVQLSDASTIKGTAYDVTVHADEINRLIDDYRQELQKDINTEQLEAFLGENAALFDGNLDLVIVLDEQNKIRSIRTQKPVHTESPKWDVNFVINFTGIDVSTEKIDGKIEICGEDEEKVFVTLMSSYDNTDEKMNETIQVSVKQNQKGAWGKLPAELSLQYEIATDTAHMSYQMKVLGQSDQKKMKIDFSGNFGDYEKGTAACIVMDHLNLYENDTQLCKITGTVYARPLSGTVDLPQWDAVPVFTLSQADAQQVYDGWKNNLMEEVQKYKDALQSLQEFQFWVN